MAVVLYRFGISKLQMKRTPFGSEGSDSDDDDNDDVTGTDPFLVHFDQTPCDAVDANRKV
jgi:hypothetical protein